MASTLSAAVAEALRAEIRSGDRAPGSRLPSEAELITRFSVSRTVIREALGSLRAEGFIRSVRGSGSFVLAQARTGLARAITLARASNHRVEDAETRHRGGEETESVSAGADHSSLLEFRIAVEVEAASLSAGRRTAGELTAIAGALQRFSVAGQDPAASLQADIAFHRTIAEASHNPYFTAVLDDLGPAMITMPDERFRADPLHVRLVNQEHRAVHDCIRGSDGPGAAAAMRTHLLQSLRRLSEGR